MTRHLLEVDDLDTDELIQVLDLAEERDPAPVLAGQGVALLFEKPSLRTRNSTEVAVFHLGGHPVTMRGEEVGLDSREPIGDIARVLGRYHAAICARVFQHDKLQQMAASAGVPVVNLLSDDSHPCQALADLLTIRQEIGRLEGVKLAYVGDFNNVARSLVRAGAMTAMDVRVACPADFGPDDEELDRLQLFSADVRFTTEPVEAIAGADVVYTDVWTSMGQEAEAERRRAAFAGFCVTSELMAAAASDAIFLHCLPAHRGEEVDAVVVDGPASRVWAQAENRLHAMRGLLLWLLEGSAA